MSMKEAGESVGVFGWGPLDEGAGGGGGGGGGFRYCEYTEGTDVVGVEEE